jgi:putative membrane protein
VTNGVKTFGGSDLIKPFYYIFLLIHMIGAASMGFLCTFLVIKSVKRFDNSQETEWKKFLFEKEYRTFHKKFGKYSFLLWMFTAISGVMVYIMLYVLSEPAHVIG